jgi:hypothetical protein
MKPYYNLPDADLRTWANTFVTVIYDNLTGYGITLQQADAVSLKSQAYVGSLESLATAQTALRNAYTTKDETREDFLADVSVLAGRIKANPSVTAQMLTAAGLPPRNSGGSDRAPVTPRDLSATGFPNGTNRLRWKSAGNTSRTVYVVEQRFSTSEDWEIVGATTSTTLETEDNTVGQMVFYRVSAQRNQSTSMPSAVVVVYGEGSALAA